MNEQREEINIDIEEREENIDVEGREKELARAGIEPTAAAPSQPDCPGVSHSDHSAACFFPFFIPPPNPQSTVSVRAQL